MASRGWPSPPVCSLWTRGARVPVYQQHAHSTSLWFTTQIIMDYYREQQCDIGLGRFCPAVHVFFPPPRITPEIVLLSRGKYNDRGNTSDPGNTMENDSHCCTKLSLYCRFCFVICLGLGCVLGLFYNFRNTTSVRIFRKSSQPRLAKRRKSGREEQMFKDGVVWKLQLIIELKLFFQQFVNSFIHSFIFICSKISIQHTKKQKNRAGRKGR